MSTFSNVIVVHMAASSWTRFHNYHSECHHYFRYTLIAQCWSEAPEERPLFKDLVHEIDSLLAGVAGYIEFSKFSSDI